MAYKRNHLNIDSSRDSVADLIASVEFLPFKEASCERVESYQTIEHFGIVTAEKILMEWWRVLVPGRMLCIETVDIISSANRFVKKESLEDLDWLYGVEEPGMMHGRCFSFSELKNLLKKVGFVSINRKKNLGVWQTGAMRVESNKSMKKLYFRVFNQIRSQVIDLLDHHQSLYRDIESILCRHFVKNFEPEKLIIDAIIISPGLGSLIIEKLVERNISTDEIKEIVLSGEI